MVISRVATVLLWAYLLSPWVEYHFEPCEIQDDAFCAVWPTNECLNAHHACLMRKSSPLKGPLHVPYGNTHHFSIYNEIVKFAQEATHSHVPKWVPTVGPNTPDYLLDYFDQGDTNVCWSLTATRLVYQMTGVWTDPYNTQRCLKGGDAPGWVIDIETPTGVAIYDYQCRPINLEWHFERVSKSDLPKALTHGPVSAYVTSEPTMFDNPGVYDIPHLAVNHAVVIVANPAPGIYTIQNSAPNWAGKSAQFLDVTERVFSPTLLLLVKGRANHQQLTLYTVGDILPKSVPTEALAAFILLSVLSPAAALGAAIAWLIYITCTTTAGLVVAGLITTLTVIRSRARFVYVSVPQQPRMDINNLKDAFEANCGERYAQVVRGQHRRLASQRRILEAECFDALTHAGYDRVRDVGGSRTRFPELAAIKHICSAVNQPADILREYKDQQHVFENCRKPGQYCPERRNIPAAILSHVDYYLTPDELTKVITGPTFIINHQFGGPGTTGEFASLRDEEGNIVYSEASWANDHGTIRMTTDDGTPYFHGHNLWKAEGTCAGPGGAFSYVRVHKAPDCQVILCVPAEGQYSTSDSTQLKREGILPTTRLRVNGVNVYAKPIVGETTKFAYYDDHQRKIAVCPANIITSSAERLALAHDDRYEQHVTNFVHARLSAENRELLTHIAVIRAHVSYMADERVLALREEKGVITSADLEGQRRWLSMRVRARRFIRGVWSQPWRTSVAWVDKWLSTVTLGRAITVPGYEIHANIENATEITQAVADRFRGRPPPDNAGADGGADDGAAQEQAERPGEHGNARAQPRPLAEPFNLRPDAPEFLPRAPERVQPPLVDGPNPGHDIEDAGRAGGGQRPGGVRGDAEDTNERRAECVDHPCEEHFEDGTPGPVLDCAGFMRFERFPQYLAALPPDALFGNAFGFSAAEEPHRRGQFDFFYHEFAYQVTVRLGTFVPRREHLLLTVQLLAALSGVRPDEVPEAVRWALRVAAGDNAAQLGVDPFNRMRVRLLRYAPQAGAANNRWAAYTPVTIRGVGYAVPRRPAGRIEIGQDGIRTLVGPGQEGRAGQVFPQERGQPEDGRPAQHIPQVGPFPINNRPLYQRGRARVGPPQNAAEGHNLRERGRQQRADEAYWRVLARQGAGHQRQARRHQ